MSVFFQAKDGIRDVDRSRGLGDVYRGQVEALCQGPGGDVADHHLEGDDFNLAH